MLLSIIIPVFNVENYVGACLDSVYAGNADLSSFEVIVVNDGSTDGSAGVVEGYRKRFCNLIFIEQENQGLSAARMNGLARAQGEYVWFVDSDDWVEPDSVATISRLIQEQAGFPVYVMPIRIHDKGSVAYTDDYPIDFPQITDGWKLLKDGFPQGFAQRFIIRRSLFDHPWLYFPLNHLIEDAYFCPVVLALADPAYVCDTPLYHYRYRRNSISHTFTVRSSYDLVSQYFQLKAFAQTLSQPKQGIFMAYCQRFLSFSYHINETLWNTSAFRQFLRRKSPALVAELSRNARFYSFKKWMAQLVLLTCPRALRKYQRIRQALINRLPDSFFKSERRRNRQIKAYMDTHKVVKLQIGCGPNWTQGWLNTDVDIDRCKQGLVYLDAGEKFPFPDNSIDYVYSEHLFEHLSHTQAVNMLDECRRVLKPSGAIRIATPDFRFLIGLYLHPEEPLNQRYIQWSGQGGGGYPVPETPLHIINKFHTAWGHRIIYDRESLESLMKEHGFKDIRICEIGKSDIPAFRNVEGHFKYMPYEFYQLETMILEGNKDYCI